MWLMITQLPTKVIVFFPYILLLLLLSRFSPVRLFETPSTVTYQAPRSMGFSRQEYWSGLSFPSPSFLIYFINILGEQDISQQPNFQVGSHIKAHCTQYLRR